jgi:hypothetical protein
MTGNGSAAALCSAGPASSPSQPAAAGPSAPGGLMTTKLLLVRDLLAAGPVLSVGTNPPWSC